MTGAQGEVLQQSIGINKSLFVLRKVLRVPELVCVQFFPTVVGFVGDALKYCHPTPSIRRSFELPLPVLLIPHLNRFTRSSKPCRRTKALAKPPLSSPSTWLPTTPTHLLCIAGASILYLPRLLVAPF